MRIKNLKLKSAILTLGLSFVLTGCNDYETEIHIDTYKIEKSIENDEMIEQVSLEIQNEEIEQSDLNEQDEIIEEVILEQEEVIEYKENIYNTTSLNLREDSNTNCEILTVIDKCQKLVQIEDLGEWSYVKYGDLYGYVSNDYIKELPDEYIEVDISDQKLKYHNGEEIMLESDVVTGKQNSMDTRIGMFEIYGKQTARYLTGANYRSYVDYWMPFDGGIGLHDASWRDEFGGEIYINSGSHGCVNLPFDTAKEIYENSEVGTKVLVHK